MQKPLPNWKIWNHALRLSATQAVALTLSVDPFKVYERSKRKWVFNCAARGLCREVAEFSDRLFLFKMRFGERAEVSPKELAEWSQSVEWNIPIELAALAPLPRTAYDSVESAIVDAALAPLIAQGAAIDELRLEIEKEGLRLVLVGGIPTIHIEDGTVEGRLAPIENLYSVLCGLCTNSKNSRIGHLVKGSGASGGGVVQSMLTHAPVPHVSPVVQPPSAPRSNTPLVPEEAASLVDVILDGAGRKTLHRLQDRSHALDAVIAIAKKNAADSSKPQSVWDALVNLSLVEPRPAPLLGHSDGEGLKYRSDSAPDGIAFYNKRAFFARCKRRRM